MNDLTTDDRLNQTIEEAKREFNEGTVQAMVDRAMAAAFGRYLEQVEAAEQRLNEAREKLANEVFTARTQVMSATDDYVTREEAQALAQARVDEQFASWRTNFDTFTDDFNQQSIQRNQMLDRQKQVLDSQIAEMLKLVKDSEQRSIENEKEIVAIKTDNERRFGQVEKDIANMRRDIDTNVKSVSDSAKRIDGQLARFFEKADKRIDKIEADTKQARRDIDGQDKAIDDIREMRSDDMKEVRRIESALNAESRIVRDIEGRVILSMTQMNAALYGEKDRDEPGLVADMRTLKSGLWWQAWMGSHPYRALLLAGAAYVAFLIVTAFVLNRPEIVAKMIPLGSSTAN